MRQCCLQCWQVLFPHPFLIHIVCQRHLWDVIPYAWSLVFLFFGPSSSLCHFKNGPEYLTRDTAQVFIPLIRFLQHSFVLSSFLILLRYSFLFFFFHLHLFDGVRLQDVRLFVGFLFSERSNLDLIYYYSYYNNFFTPCDFFTPELAGGLSRELIILLRSPGLFSEF